MLENRTITLSIKEMKRCETLKMAEEKQLTQREGAKRLNITERHFWRLLQRYRLQGPEGIVSGHREKPAVNSRLIYTTHIRMDIYQHDRFGVYHQNNTL